MAAIRNDSAPKPIGTSGNAEDLATEPEDDEYQSESDDDMDGEVQHAAVFPYPPSCKRLHSQHLRFWSGLALS